MLIILTLCLVLAWLIFAKLKIIILGWISGAVTATIGAFILSVFVALLNYRRAGARAARDEARAAAVLPEQALYAAWFKVRRTGAPDPDSAPATAA